MNISYNYDWTYTVYNHTVSDEFLLKEGLLTEKNLIKIGL